MRLLNQATELLPLDSVRPHPRNPRQGDIGAIHESITANGFYGTIIAQRSTGYILAGNHRWQALRKTGVNTVPVTWVDVDDDHALRILLADNRTNDLATYDDTALSEILKDIMEDAGTLAGTGYDGDDLDDLLKDLGQDQPEVEAPEAQVDRADELQAKWGTALGQLWQIGPHRLLCGDSTSAEDAERLFGATEANLVFTDPPYGVDYQGGTTKREKLVGDHRGTNIYAAFLPLAVKHSETRAPFYIWHAGAVGMPVLQAIAENGLEVRSQIIWNKNQAQFGAIGAQYKQKHEPCFYAFKRGHAPHWHGPTNEVTVWDIDRERANEHHPTQKPPALAERAITNSSERGSIVADFFAGSGSTIIGAENTDRVCYALELNPGYVAVILQRLADMGLTPELAD